MSNIGYWEEDDELPSINRRRRQRGQRSGNGRRGRVSVKVTSDLPTLKSELMNYGISVTKLNINKKPNAQLADFSVSGTGFLDIIDYIDREPDADANAMYAESGFYIESGGTNKPGMRLPKIGAYAHAGVAEAHAEASFCTAHARFLHAGASVDLSVNGLGASAMATAELASASANAGPLGLKVGLAADTGAKLGAEGVEVKFLGTGFSVGPKTSVSILGSEASCAIM